MPRTVTFAARANAAGEWLLVANALQRRAPVVSESPEPVLAGHEEQVDANGRRWVADHLRAKRLAWSSRPMSATGSSARRARYPAMAHDPDDRLETAGSAFRFTRLPTSVTNLASSVVRIEGRPRPSPRSFFPRMRSMPSLSTMRTGRGPRPDVPGRSSWHARTNCLGFNLHESPQPREHARDT